MLVIRLPGLSSQVLLYNTINAAVILPVQKAPPQPHLQTSDGHIECFKPAF